ncbi:MAG: hypothetical protein JHD16_16875, partial [Solirubrobacteraceae bacterium]|nr:hypothetical protein [Solirubrobacteraceae bacterium]
QGLLKVDLSGEQIQITGDLIQIESAYELKIDRLRITECLKAKNWITPEDYDNLKRLAEGALTMKLMTTAGGLSSNVQNYAPALGALDSITSGAWEEYVVGSRFSFWGSGGVLSTIGDPNNPFLGRDRRERMLILLQRCSDPIRPPVQPAPQRQEVFQSNDPNDKLGTTGGGDARAIRSDTRLAYTVRFQNKPDASAAAQIVVVDDQLDPAKVDLNSASLGPITVGGDLVLTPPTGATSWTTVKDLRPANDLLLKVEATLNTTTGAARWTFTSLDPVTLAATTDALAGFLPPDSSPPAGQGSVSYLALPKAGIASGTTIGGDAAIKFDSNDVLRTNVWSNLIDDEAPTSAVSSVSPTACNKLDVKWSGSDAASGIESYDVFVSVDGGAFEPWLTRTTGTSATYQGAAGRTYAFDVQARDFATNLQGDGRGDAVSGTPTCPDPPTPPVVSGDGGNQVPLGGNPPAVIVPAPKPWVTFGKLATSLKKNRFELKVTCVQTESAGCAGNVTLTTSVKKGKKTTLTTLGSAKFSKLKAGKTVTVKVKISKKGLALLRSGARSVTVTAKPSVKSDPRTTTATARLKKLKR